MRSFQIFVEVYRKFCWEISNLSNGTNDDQTKFFISRTELRKMQWTSNLRILNSSINV